jgi:NDP-sugar pyrophosphorylase family protein
VGALMSGQSKRVTKAMVLAAGLGTRLRPLTDGCPKALVELNGRTLLEITLARLRRFGIVAVIVNVHHCADRLEEYLRTHNFGMQVEISREDELLDTGGGLLKTASFFQDAEPFLLHNVDVISDIDLGDMVKLHCREDALATIAVQQRKSSRCLLLDAKLRLCGRRVAGQPDELACVSSDLKPWAFAGIHVLSPRIFGLMKKGLMKNASMSNALRKNADTDNVSTTNFSAAIDTTALASAPAFSIIPEYLRLAAAGEKILGFAADGAYWRDLGTPASLQQAAADVQLGVIHL